MGTFEMGSGDFHTAVAMPRPRAFVVVSMGIEQAKDLSIRARATSFVVSSSPRKRVQRRKSAKEEGRPFPM